MAALEGKTLNRYELRRLVGRGGMANVYEGYDPYFQRAVAVKVFKREEEEMLRRFIREARLMASLNNPHLVPIYDTGECEIDGDTRYYIVMPFMEGGTLRARIRRSPFTLAEACHCLRDIADALDYIHGQGIVHRDIKASNVLLSADGDYYLTDFGIARMISDATQLTSTGNVLGTVDYIAPELFEVHRRSDARSDLYSLGVLLFEMVTGQLPFSAENQLALVSMHISKLPPAPRSIDPRIPQRVEAVMLKALEKKPEQRYASAAELADAFCRALSAGVDTPTQRPFPLADATEGFPLASVHHEANLPPESVEAPAPPLPPRPAPVEASSRRRRSPLVALLALLLLLALTVPLVYILLTHGTNSNSDSSISQTTSTTGVHTSTSLPTATPNQTATAQAAAAATATARANATVTAIAAITVTAEAKASATAGVIQTATSGKPVYQDALNNANNSGTVAADWDQDGHCAFQSDGYHVTEGSSLHGCKESANTYQNVAITVNMQIISGHSGGIYFRVSTDFFNDYSGYLFEVDSMGRYKISSSDHFSFGMTVLQDWTSSSALKQGYKATNTLQVIARGSSLSFYANGVFLVHLTDTNYTSGVVAFLASSAGTQTEVVYSNLKVYPLS